MTHTHTLVSTNYHDMDNYINILYCKKVLFFMFYVEWKSIGDKLCQHKKIQQKLSCSKNQITPKKKL